MEVSATSLRIHPRENNIHADTSWTLHLGVLPSLCEGGLISTDVTSRYVCANVGVELKWGIHSHYHGVSQAPVSVGPPCNPNLKHVFSYCLGTKIDPVCVCACVCVGGAADRFDKTIAPTGLLFAFKNLQLQIWDQSKTSPPCLLVGLIGTCVALDTVASAVCCAVCVCAVLPAITTNVPRGHSSGSYETAETNVLWGLIG